MKIRITHLKIFVSLLSLLLLNACGGGSSDSGGAQNDVTVCIDRQTETSNLAGIDVTKYTFLNTCDFAVNLGYGLLSVSTITALEPGESTSTFIPVGFIACRPPSQPFYRDDSGSRGFACTD